jgi:hypothetical protein
VPFWLYVKSTYTGDSWTKGLIAFTVVNTNWYPGCSKFRSSFLSQQTYDFKQSGLSVSFGNMALNSLTSAIE